MIISAFAEVLLPVLVVVVCGYALRRVFPIDLRWLNSVRLTYICARPLRLDAATLSALLLSTQNENQQITHSDTLRAS